MENTGPEFERAVRWIVVHPTKGSMEVLARCGRDAKLAAAAFWDIPFPDALRLCKVGVETEALRNL